MKFDHILFPIDFSGNSRPLNHQVEWFARTFQSHVTLLHVFEIPASWYGGLDGPLLLPDDIAAFKDAENKRLKEYEIDVPESQINRVLLEGGTAWHIATWVREHATDLIAMGTHGFGTARRLMLGSVTMNVLHDVDCPVWTQTASSAKDEMFQGVKKIVFPLELTEEAVPLLRFAKEVSADFGAEVQLIHTIPFPDSAVSIYSNVNFNQRLSELARETIAQRQKEAGTAFPLRIMRGHIEQDAAEAATEQRAGLILIGRGQSRGVLGSLRTHAYGIIRHAPCPVLSYSMNWVVKEFSALRSENLAAVTATV